MSDKTGLDKARENMQWELRSLCGWHQIARKQISERKAAEEAYPEMFESLKNFQSLYEKTLNSETVLRAHLESLRTEHAETSAMASALKEELTRFYKLPSPCGVGMDLEVDMRGSVRVGALQPRMSALASGALAEGDVILSIDGQTLNGEDVEMAKRLLVGKRASMVAIKVQRAKHVFVVNLKRGSWGPDHASVSTEHAQKEADGQSGGALLANEQGSEPRPSKLEAPSSALPGSKIVAPQQTAPRKAWQNDEDADAEGSLEATGNTSMNRMVLVQGNYAAARRSQGNGPLAMSPED